MPTRTITQVLGIVHRIQNGRQRVWFKEYTDYILNYLSFMEPVRHDVFFYEPFSLIGLEITLL